MIRAVVLPWRLPRADPWIPADVAPADGGPLVDAGPPGVRGELDTRIDPRFGLYTASNLSEAFPGPMTPLSLDLTGHAMRASAQTSARLLRLPPRLATELSRSVSFFGHRVYGGVSVLRELAAVVPGWSPEEIDHQYLGIARDPGGRRPRRSVGDAARAAALGAAFGLRAAGFSGEVRRVVARAADRLAEARRVADLDDAALCATIDDLHDEVVWAWQVSTFGTVLAGGILSTIERAGAVPSAGRGEELASVGALAGVARLAARARGAPGAAAVLRTAPPDVARAELCRVAPWFEVELLTLLRDHGHRGPGETELANDVFADDPTLLVSAVAKALDATPRRAAGGSTRSARLRALDALAWRAMRSRERSRDAVVQMTHALRLAVRERGRRLERSGTTQSAGDVFFLTFAQLRDPPPEAQELVRARRTERTRRAGLRMPPLFEGHWEPVTETREPLTVGDALVGIAASPGIVQGRARLVTAAKLLELEPGEVLVAVTTDTGWTPLFAFAAAVVTDVGAQISHAAVVAREFGIPAVVGTREATSRLRDGQLVEVDGRAGTVRAIAEPSSG
jgi:phosphohistidine swiveling domain-containing protein